MSRYLRILLAVIATLLLLGAGTSSASRSTYHNPILQGFELRCNLSGVISGSSLDLCISLSNQSGFFYVPPKNGGIAVKVTLYLPPGIKITKSRVTWDARGLSLAHKPTAAEKQFRMVKDSKGVMRPVWKFYHLEQPILPIWHFSLNAPASRAKICVGAVATPIGLAGAPVQTTKSCYSRKM